MCMLIGIVLAMFAHVAKNFNLVRIPTENKPNQTKSFQNERNQQAPYSTDEKNVKLMLKCLSPTLANGNNQNEISHKDIINKKASRKE